jgi:hypothetical protein
MKLGQAQAGEPKGGRQVHAAGRHEDQGKLAFHSGQVGQARVIAVQDSADAPQELNVVWAFDDDKQPSGTGRAWRAWSKEARDRSD